MGKMRFYRQSHTYRVWGSVLWGLVLLLWIPAFSLHHIRHPWQPLIWIFLAIVQLGTLWTYWDISSTELVAHTFGFHRTYQLSGITQVGPPASHRRLLSKTVQVDYRGRQILYITVADRSLFQETLRLAAAKAPHEPPTIGPLGLST